MPCEVKFFIPSHTVLLAACFHGANIYGPVTFIIVTLFTACSFGFYGDNIDQMMTWILKQKGANVSLHHAVGMLKTSLEELDRDEYQITQLH